MLMIFIVVRTLGRSTRPCILLLLNMILLGWPHFSRLSWFENIISLSAKELMLLNCGVGEDSWESLGLQGYPTSPSERKSVLNIHWKDWCSSWSSNTLTTWCEELTIRKDPDTGKDWRWEEKGTTEDEMVGWRHWREGHESE